MDKEEGNSTTPAKYTPQEIQAYKKKYEITRFQEDRVERFLKRIEEGHDNDTACDYSSIGESTLYKWFQDKMVLWWREKPLELREAYKKAQSFFEVKHVGNIEMHAKDNWQASMTLLERRRPLKYGKVDRLQHGGAVLHAHVETKQEQVIGAMDPALLLGIQKLLKSSNGTGKVNGKGNGKQNRIIDAEAI